MVAFLNDCMAIQEEIAKIEVWCNLNDSYSDARKCNVISFTKIKPPCRYKYTINNTEISRLNTVKDSGVIFD